MRSVARTRRAATAGGGRSGAAGGRSAVGRSGRCGCGGASGRGCGIRLGCRASCGRTARATTEVRHIPARTLELEAGSSELFLERRRAACGAIRQRRVAHLLQHIFGVAAGVASISIDRHGVLTLEQTNDKKAMDCPRGPRTRCEKRARRAHGRLGQLRAVQVLARKALNYKPFRGNSRPQIRSGRWRCATKWHTAHARNETLRLA